jgi:hypothetical protein
MKTKEEIEQLAEQYWAKQPYNEDAYVIGYTQCQEDMAKELELLRESIRKNTWYDVDGNAQVNLYGIDNNLLNKQD